MVGIYKTLDCNAVWRTVLTCADEPVFAVREQSNGLNAAVCSFDLHDSDLPLQAKYLSFISDLLEFLVPSMLSSNDLSYGQSVEIRALPDADDILVYGPEEQVRSLPMIMKKALFRPSALGVYSAAQVFEKGEETRADLFVHIPQEECLDNGIDELPYFVTPSVPDGARDATSEIAFYIAIVMLILLMAEWGLYIYEQF